MYFASYLHEGKEGYGVLNKDRTEVIPMKVLLKVLNKEVPENLLEFIRKYSDSLIEKLEDMASVHLDKGILLEDVELTAPIPYPRRNVFCLGKNYKDHIGEVKNLPGNNDDIPLEPIYFTKVADPAIGHMDEVTIPVGVTDKVDYEVELAIIIGKDGKDISIQDVEDHIFGYTIGNDFSARDLQSNHSQWFKGKSVDTFTAIGPYIVHKAETGHPPVLDISCKVNGELRQNSNTNKLIFDIHYIVSDLSKGLTLRAGDIILTGTPAGVGMGFDPPKYLKSGDTVECSIEKIGTLVNYID